MRRAEFNIYPEKMRMGVSSHESIYNVPSVVAPSIREHGTTVPVNAIASVC